MHPNEPTAVESCGVIDAELAEQLTDLIDAMEAVRWNDVPDIPVQGAAAFTRRLIEARSTLLTPRVITDGGEDLEEARFSREEYDEIWSVADDDIWGAYDRLTEQGGPNIDEAIVLLDRAIRRLVPFSEVHEPTESGGYILHIEEGESET